MYFQLGPVLCAGVGLAWSVCPVQDYVMALQTARTSVMKNSVRVASLNSQGSVQGRRV